MAHMWLNIGAANSNENAVGRRKPVAQRMTPEEISKAQALARECMNSDYKECEDLD